MKSLPKLLISRRKTVGIRVPDSPIAVGLVRELGHPILSTSVSQGEGDYLNDPDRIIPSYKDVVDLIIDSGLLTSEPSTILDLSDEVPVVVRRGAGDVSRFV
jgi:tRNA threonylcarbamoyl adenosine modification protein (Sua5/YciO/YrdC/YwlC family)